MIRKTSIMNITVLSLLVLIALSSSSCMAADRTDLVKTGAVTIEQYKDAKAYIAWSSEYEEAGELVITGVLRRSDHVGRPIKTHVDLAIVSPDGAIVSQASSSAVSVSRRITGRGYQSFERFKIRLANVPAKGSVVKLTSHSGTH